MPDRSPDAVDDADLDRLLEIELAWRRSLEQRRAHWRHYGERLLGICLAQGGAKHLIDGVNGLKDFDVYRLFAASPDRPAPDPAIFRGKTHVDFGPSHFGDRRDPQFRSIQARHPAIVHRNVDIYSLALPCEPGADPVPALRAVLSAPRTHKLDLLSRKPMILVDRRPPRVVWPVEFEDAELRGYRTR